MAQACNCDCGAEYLHTKRFSLVLGVPPDPCASDHHIQRAGIGGEVPSVGLGQGSDSVDQDEVDLVPRQSQKQLLGVERVELGGGLELRRCRRSAWPRLLRA